MLNLLRSKCSKCSKCSNYLSQFHESYGHSFFGSNNSYKKHGKQVFTLKTWSFGNKPSGFGKKACSRRFPCLRRDIAIKMVAYWLFYWISMRTCTDLWGLCTFFNAGHIFSISESLKNLTFVIILSLFRRPEFHTKMQDMFRDIYVPSCNYNDNNAIKCQLLQEEWI